MNAIYEFTVRAKTLEEAEEIATAESKRYYGDSPFHIESMRAQHTGYVNLPDTIGGATSVSVIIEVVTRIAHIERPTRPRRK